ncbi:MAG: hypothetical protein Q4D86_04290 [Pasteurella oralis]|uniref:hypothetical protein n=1 Tax=Pasteurella oralis TaxID=1071947 RepID=UPI000C7B7E1F|nr:hypothetical protein [Pasteurella oralis]MDO5054519.1 hypothetical protein [Pasteurella oralis]
MHFKVLLFASLLLSNVSFAESWFIHISENSFTKTYGSPETQHSDERSLLDIHNEQPTHIAYVNRSSTRKLNPGMDIQDAEALGKSIEFEVFQINETKSSHTIFESGAGICKGFNSRVGVDVTDATTYYVVPVNKAEYYTNISTATVSSKADAKNMQYVPVFYIQDPKLAKKVQAEENKQGKNLADQNIQHRKNMLSGVICR